VTTREPATRTRRRGFLTLLLVVAPILVYAHGLSAPFVLDDDETIVRNPSIRQLWALPGALSAPDQLATAGRPLVNLTFAVNYALGGTSPWGYRATNLAIHLLAGLVVFGIARRTLRKRMDADRSDWLAFFIALLWLLHPLPSEVIGYVTQRTESLAALFLLFTIFAAIRGFEDPARRAWWSGAAVISCALAMASKESTIVTPVLVLLYDAVFESGSVRRALTSRAPFYTALAGTWLLLLGLILPGPRSKTAGFSAGVTPITYLLNQPPLILRYLRLAVWPRALVVDYGPATLVPFRQIAPAAVVVGLLGFGVFLAWRRYPDLAFLGAWFFITLAPSSSIVPIASEVGAERRMYLPLMAIVTLVAIALRTLRPYREVLAALAVLCAVATWQRVDEYGDRLTLLQTVLERHPDGRAHFNVGAELAARGNHEGAIGEYRQAMSESPEAELALGFELHARGQDAQAVEHLRAYVRRKPDGPEIAAGYQALGGALASLHRTDEAIDAFRHVLQIDPRNRNACRLIGDALLATSKLTDAIDQYEGCIKQGLDLAVTRYNLGTALAMAGRVGDAVEEFRAAVAIDPRNASARNNLAATLQSVGKVDEAAVEYRETLAVDPGNVDAHNNYGRLLMNAGDAKDAAEQFQQALAHRPDWPVALEGLAWVRATAAQPETRRPLEALQLAERAAQLTKRRDALVLDSLAAAYAANGEFERARDVAREALALNPPAALSDGLKQRASLYAKHQTATMRARA
jgi:tetratricopeptide (TPR) repeat protein